MSDHADGLVDHDRHHVRRHHVGLAGLGKKDAGEIAEVLGRICDIYRARLSNGLAVVDGFDEGEMFGVFFDDIGDGVENARSLALLRRFP